MARLRWFPLVGFSLSLALLASPLSAQEKKTPGRPFAGGFGGAMFGMGDTSKLGLLRLEQVQTELKVTQDQKDKVAELQKGISDATPRGERGQNLSAEERKKVFAEAREKREKLTAEAEKKLDGILKTEQTKRLNEIHLQQRGVQGLKDEAIAKALKLDEEQIKKIDAALQWGQEERTKLFQNRGEKGSARDPNARTEMRDKQEKIQKEVETKALAALTDSQKGDYEKMKGSPFKLDRSALPGPGAGGQRGGRGAGKADAKA